MSIQFAGEMNHRGPMHQHRLRNRNALARILGVGVDRIPMHRMSAARSALPPPSRAASFPIAGAEKIKSKFVAFRCPFTSGVRMLSVIVPVNAACPCRATGSAFTPCFPLDATPSVDIVRSNSARLFVVTVHLQLRGARNWITPSDPVTFTADAGVCTSRL